MLVDTWPDLPVVTAFADEDEACWVLGTTADCTVSPQLGKACPDAWRLLCSVAVARMWCDAVLVESKHGFFGVGVLWLSNTSARFNAPGAKFSRSFPAEAGGIFGTLFDGPPKSGNLFTFSWKLEDTGWLAGMLSTCLAGWLIVTALMHLADCPLGGLEDWLTGSIARSLATAPVGWLAGMVFAYSPAPGWLLVAGFKLLTVLRAFGENAILVPHTVGILEWRSCTNEVAVMWVSLSLYTRGADCSTQHAG